MQHLLDDIRSSIAQALERVALFNRVAKRVQFVARLLLSQRDSFGEKHSRPRVLGAGKVKSGKENFRSGCYFFTFVKNL